MTDGSAFLRGLVRQRDRYRSMVAVVEEQKGLLASSDMDALMELIERKRALMGEIESAEKDLTPMKERWRDLRDGLDTDTVREVERAVEETRQILKSIVRIEDEGRSLMEKQRESADRELKGLMARKARGAYGGRP